MKMPVAHHLREQISGEILSHPYEPVSPPGRILYIVMTTSPEERTRQKTHLGRLSEMYDDCAVDNSGNQIRYELGDVALKVEIHRNFTRYKLAWKPSASIDDAPFSDKLPDSRLAQWVADIPGHMLTCVDASILELPHTMRNEEANLIERYSPFFAAETLVASRMGRSGNLVMTDFQITQDKTIRMLVLSRAPRAAQNGRLILRLMEVETYRMMGMLALPHARHLFEILPTIDRQLNELTGSIARADNDTDEELLETVSKLAGEVERLVTRYHRELSQADEYFSTTFKRLDELREQPVAEIPPIGGTLKSRLEPAVDSCRSAAHWLEQVSLRISYATHLLRTRVDVKREEQNQQLLKGVNNRFKTQLRLQETAELLSIVVIPYYAANLVGYITESVDAFLHAGVDPALAKTITIPVIVVLVYILLRRSKKGHTLPF